MPLLRAVPIALVLLLAAPAWGQETGNFGALYIDPRACWEPNDHVAQRTSELVRRHSYCRRDSDCVLLDTRASCGLGCGAFVNRRSVARVARQVRQLDRRHCQQSDCSGPLLLCGAPRASCVNNRCEARWLPPRPNPGLFVGGPGQPSGPEPSPPVPEVPGGSPTPIDTRDLPGVLFLPSTGRRADGWLGAEGTAFPWRGGWIVILRDREPAP